MNNYDLVGISCWGLKTWKIDIFPEGFLQNKVSCFSEWKKHIYPTGKVKQKFKQLKQTQFTFEIYNADEICNNANPLWTLIVLFQICMIVYEIQQPGKIGHLRVWLEPCLAHCECSIGIPQTTSSVAMPHGSGLSFCIFTLDDKNPHTISTEICGIKDTGIF